MMQVIADNEKSSFDCKKIHRNTYSWYGNNGLVRFEYPLSENDNGYNILHDMFETLVKERNVPDVDFFLLKRDFPILKKNRCEPYDAFFGSDRPLLSHCYEKYVPILSMNGNDTFEDISIPTWEDWRRVSYWHDKRLFAKDYYTYPTVDELQSVPWHTRRPTAVWRGSSTGRGSTTQDNIRLFVHNLSKSKEMSMGNYSWMLKFPNGITSAEASQNMYLTSISGKQFDFSKRLPFTVTTMSIQVHFTFTWSYMCLSSVVGIILDGSSLLSFEYKLWFTHRLQPCDYVPLNETCDEHGVYKLNGVKNTILNVNVLQKSLAFAQNIFQRTPHGLLAEFIL